MAQDPEATPQDPERDPESDVVDTSHDLDMVPFFSSSNHDAEMEALAIQAILEANGIPAVFVGATTIPSLEFQVQVPRARLDEAERVVAEARAAGPEAAAEAEAAGEAASEGAV